MAIHARTCNYHHNYNFLSQNLYIICLFFFYFISCQYVLKHYQRLPSSLFCHFCRTVLFKMKLYLFLYHHLIYLLQLLSLILLTSSISLLQLFWHWHFLSNEWRNQSSFNSQHFVTRFDHSKCLCFMMTFVLILLINRKAFIDQIFNIYTTHNQ
jgi:hypothetical protein